MDEGVRFACVKVMKQKTNVFISEINHLMEEEGVGKVLRQGNIGGKEKPPGRTQFKALMDAAGEASCIEELLLFLSYQKSKGGGWQIKCGGNEDISQKISKCLKSNIMKMVEVLKEETNRSLMKIQEDVFDAIEKEAKAGRITQEDERIIRLEIAEKYMGYLYWKASVESRS